MKIAIIGAGHIGSAIVTCLAQGHLYNEKDIIVSNPNIDKLERLQEHFPAIHITTDNQQAISEAEVIVLAINPWKVDEVLSPLRFSRTQILVSLVSGVCISHLAHLTEAEIPTSYIKYTERSYLLQKGSALELLQKEISALESVQREIIQNITRAKYGLSETGENKREKIFD